MKNTIKEYIEKHVLLKIGSEEWKEGDIIPSETALSKQFECSRITVRSALSTFVSAGILLPIKGIGYQLLEFKDKLFNSIHDKYQTNNNKTEMMESSSVEKILKQAKASLDKDWKVTKAHDSFKCFKKLFYKDEELIVAQISIVNINVLWGIQTEQILNSLTKSLFQNGIIPNRVSQKIFFGNVPILSQYFEELGFEKEQALIEIAEISNEDSWIEFSVRIVKKEKVCFKKTSLLVTSGN